MGCSDKNVVFLIIYHYERIAFARHTYPTGEFFPLKRSFASFLPSSLLS